MTVHLDSLDAAVEFILQHTPQTLRMGAPLGIGKPHRLLNALHARLRQDASRPWLLYTALSLDPPQAHAGLEARFLKPFASRHFGDDFPRLDYVQAMKRDALPAHIEIEEFYMQSGALLSSSQAQRRYASLNYTHVARALGDRALNVIVQKVAREPGGRRLSLSCNNDLTQDAVEAVLARGLPRPLLVAEVDPQLPWLGGTAAVDEDYFDAVVTPPVPIRCCSDCRASRCPMRNTRSACTPARWCATAVPCRSASARWPTRCAMRWSCAIPTTPPTAK